MNNDQKQQNTNIEINNEDIISLDKSKNKKPLMSEQNIKKTKTSLKYFGLLLLILPILFIMILSGYALNAKQSYQYALAGKNDLEASINLALDNDFQNAGEQANQANHNFSLSAGKINSIQSGFFIKYIPLFVSEINNVDNLLVTGQLVSQSLIDASDFASEVNVILDNNNASNLSNLDISKKTEVLEKLITSEARFLSIQEKINEAAESLNNVKTSGLLWSMKDKISNLQDKLNQGQSFINKATPLTKIAPTLAGFPEKARYLVLFQNSDRLRPIGGTVGTYGILEIDKGEIVSYNLYDANYIDELTKNKKKIDPPASLAKLTNSNNWLFRDINWSPDWPTTAKKAEWFYRTKLLNVLKTSNNKECPIADCSINFDGVIGINPELAIDLLAITGPIEVDGATYNKDNFIKLYESELNKAYIGNDYANNKLLIAKIVKEVQLKIFNLPFSNWPELGSIIAKNADDKNILIYSKNKELEDLLIKQNWAGNLIKTNGDYLMIVDTNLPAARVNKNVSEYAHYEVEQTKDKLTGKLTIKYAYLKNNENRNYKNYVRIFTPLGSRIVKSSINLNKITIENDLGKTSFGAYLEIKPGTLHEFYIEYELPSAINQTALEDHYSLYIQKQPGNSLKEMEVFTHLANNIKEIKGDSFYSNKISDTKAFWKTDLTHDLEFKALISK